MNDWVTTTTLLEDLRDFSNAAAWDRFVGRFHRPVTGFVRELGVPPSEAEDVAQETLVAFAESYRDGRYDRPRGRLSSWLFGIAFRQALRRRRSARRRGIEEPLDAAPEALIDEAAVTDLWNRHWDGFIVRECLARARAEFRPLTFLAFEKVVQEEGTPPEVAMELGLSVKAVYNAKHRVLRRMRELRAELEGPV
jgi:RNA polymerase sigma-70 factor (ECF subfamily)